MAKSIEFLSEKDIASIQRLIQFSQTFPRNKPTRTELDLELAIQSPDVFVAKTPATGIAALSSLSPSSQLCNIYELVNGNLLDTGFVRQVYNLSSTAIPSNAYVIVRRDKFGKWFVVYVADRAHPDGETLDILTCVSPVKGTLQNGATVLVDGSGSTTNRIQTGYWVEKTRLNLALGNSTPDNPECEQDPECCQEDTPDGPGDCVTVGTGTGTGGGCIQVFCRTMQLTLTGASGCSCVSKTVFAEYDDVSEEWQTGPINTLGCGGTGSIEIAIYFNAADTSWRWTVTGSITDSGTIVSDCSLLGSSFNITVNTTAICPAGAGTITVGIAEATYCRCNLYGSNCFDNFWATTVSCSLMPYKWLFPAVSVTPAGAYCVPNNPFSTAIELVSQVDRTGVYECYWDSESVALCNSSGVNLGNLTGSLFPIDLGLGNVYMYLTFSTQFIFGTGSGVVTYRIDIDNWHCYEDNTLELVPGTQNGLFTGWPSTITISPTT